MVEETPAVTVIIPTYNSNGTLRLTLETVLLQDFDDFEVWVVGDGCTDDSETIVSSFGDKRFHWVNLPVNSGTPSIPRNEALRRARGRLIAYLGHDDLWFPWHLSELVDCADKSNSDFVYSLGVFVEPAGFVNTFTLPDKAWDGNALLSPSNWLHRSGLIKSVGLWSQDIKTKVDREFLHRVLAAGVRLNFRRQISVLKFPSAAWRMFSLDSNFPQASYVEAMRNNAVELRLELLLNYASDMSETGVWRQRRSSPKTIRALRWISNLYGHQRWPMNELLYWRQRWKTGRSRKKRSE